MNNKKVRTEKMTESKEKTQIPAELSNVSTYRLSRSDYQQVQRARQMAKIEKLKAAEYTRDDGCQDMRVVYRLHGKTYEAHNLDEFARIIAEQLANKIEQWTPNESVYVLSELISAAQFCDPTIRIDRTRIQSARIPQKLSGLVVVTDNAGWGFTPKGEIINCDETLSSIKAAEQLGMVFAR
jgi:hypothetical protein